MGVDQSGEQDATAQIHEAAFYLAQSWRDAGELEEAVEAYRRRAAMGGWEEEVYVALLEVGRLCERLERDDAEITDAYLRAHERQPHRAEAAYHLARFHRERGRFDAGFAFARVATAIPRPARALFQDESVYSWRALDELAMAALHLGRVDVAVAANRELLDGTSLPAAERPRIERSLESWRAVIDET